LCVNDESVESAECPRLSCGGIHQFEFHQTVAPFEWRLRNDEPDLDGPRPIDPQGQPRGRTVAAGSLNSSGKYEQAAAVQRDVIAATAGRP
jgi:hypothetical protein